MSVILEARGIDFNDFGDPHEVPDKQAKYQFEIHCRGLELPDEIDTRRLIESWYIVGFHGGFGGWMNQLSEVTREDNGSNQRVEFAVVGVISKEAIQVLLRCLDSTDIDAFFDRVVIVATDV